MASLLDILTQKQPQFQTNQALLVLDLQNDFLRPDGKLPVSSRSGFLARIKKLVDTFRDNAGDVIFVRTAYAEDRNVNSENDNAETIVLAVEGDPGTPDESNEDLTKTGSAKGGGRPFDIFRKISRKGSVEVKIEPNDDPENFLSNKASRQPCCMPNSRGADFVDDIKSSIDPACDMVLSKTHYSAFKATSLLLMLRAKLITELYICGCMTNVSVYATALDAVRHGFTINIVEDCVGYRKASRHREALRQMVDIMGAFTVTSVELLNELAEQDPDVPVDTRSTSLAPEGEELTSLVKNLRLSTASSAYSSREDEARSSIEPSGRDKESLSRPSTRNGNEGPEHPLRTKRSGKLQKKMPEASKDVEESPGDHPLRSKRSKIRMRRRDSSPTGERPRDLEVPAMPPTATDSMTISPQRNRDQVEKKDSDKRPSSRGGLMQSFSRKSMDTSSDSDRIDTSVTELSKESDRLPKKTGFLSAFRRRNTDERIVSPLNSVTSASVQEDESIEPQQSHSRDVSLDPAAEVSSHIRNTSRGSDMQSKLQSLPETSIVSPLTFSPLASPLISPREVPEFAKVDTRSTVGALTSTNRSNGTSRKTSVDSFSMHGTRNSRTSASSLTIDKPDTGVGEGDSYMSTNIVPASLSSAIFQDLFEQVRWQTMFHQTGAVPRLVCVQGAFGDDGSQPIYRHPTDHALPLLSFSPSVRTVKNYVEKIVKHPLNHVLIQLYRSGQDYISEHSDKTLDIVRGSNIVNVSFGAQRTMRLRTKKSANDPQSISFDQSARQTQRIPLPHNSAFVLGHETNMRWLHGINADKRPAKERSPAEKAYQGMRISLTFRYIGTYLTFDSKLIWGQGATAKTRETARAVINNDLRQTEIMINAFGKENQATEFDWKETYGAGFDVLHFRKTPGSTKDSNACLLFLSNDPIENAQVTLYIESAGLEYTAIDAPTRQSDDYMGVSRKVCFRDSDPMHTEVQGALAVLLYLDRFHPLPYRVTANSADDTPSETRQDIARRFELMMLLNEAVDAVRAGETWLLAGIESYLQEGGYVAGREFGYADCAYYPVLERCWDKWDEKIEGEIPMVRAYMARMKPRVENRGVVGNAERPGRKLSTASKW